jgi:hypothetical protein
MKFYDIDINRLRMIVASYDSNAPLEQNCYLLSKKVGFRIVLDAKGGNSE